MENLEAQRAAITAELTQAALTGGDTAKAREKLARLDERERAAQEAAQARDDAQRQQAEADMAARGLALANETIERLRVVGVEVSDIDAQNLTAYARTVARHEAEIQAAEAASLLAQSKAQQVRERIQVLTERANALSALRLTGQATERDTGEAVLIERDLALLAETLRDAEAAATAAHVPSAMHQQHQAAMAALQAQERAVTLDSLRSRAKAAEAAYLAAVRQLVAASGAVHTSQAFTRDAAVDRWVNFGTL